MMDEVLGMCELSSVCGWMFVLDTSCLDQGSRSIYIEAMDWTYAVEKIRRFNRC